MCMWMTLLKCTFCFSKSLVGPVMLPVHQARKCADGAGYRPLFVPRPSSRGPPQLVIRINTEVGNPRPTKPSAENVQRLQTMILSMVTKCGLQTNLSNANPASDLVWADTLTFILMLRMPHLSPTLIWGFWAFCSEPGDAWPLLCLLIGQSPVPFWSFLAHHSHDPDPNLIAHEAPY